MDMATGGTSYGEGLSEDMDASLWGGLQNHVDLAIVYAKLPIGDFFRLRRVCKDWNRLASDRGFLEESFPHPIPEPYFVVNSREMKHRLLSYNASSRRWNWTRLPPTFCTAGGLLCDYGRGECDRIRVFNVHTRMFITLPCLSDHDDCDDDPLIGMTVDTSVSPCTFQIIFGDENSGTRIYRSKSKYSWTYSASTPQSYWVISDNPLSDPTCAHCNGFVYVRVWRIYGGCIDVYAYNLETDAWNENFTLPYESRFVTYDIGVWQERLFLFGMSTQPRCSIQAWECCGNPDYPTDWAAFDRMPEDLCLWMLAANDVDDFRDYEVIEMLTRFCGEYVLVCNCVGLEEVAQRAVLYNLARKTWERVEVPGPRRLVSPKAAREEKDARVALRNARLRKNLAVFTYVYGKAWNH